MIDRVRTLMAMALPLAALVACTPVVPIDTADGGTPTPAPAADEIIVSDQQPPKAPPPQTPSIAADLIRADWEAADNRDACPALAFGNDSGANGSARRAEFSGGWGVAFDLPNLRSAYGIAGTGLLEERDMDQARTALMAQWPLFRDLTALPQPALAGYGVEGAKPYPADNPDGTGVNSITYIRISNSPCLYNVWSRLGRAHLEAMLDTLRLL